MPRSYTTNLGIIKPADGEEDGVWGDLVNDNMDILDIAINGVLSLSLSGTSSTLTTSDGLVSNGQYRLLSLTGSPSGTHTITISPNDADKVYFVRNTTAQSVVFTQGSGGNVTIATGDSAIIYANGGGAGAAVENLTDHFAMSSVKITGGSITGITDLAVADGGTGASDAATARTNLGLGTIATQSAASVAITGGSITGITDLAVADGGTGASTAANARTNLGLAIGTDVQAYDAELTAIAALAVTDGNFIVGNGTTWVAESGATARTSLGLGSIATQASSSVSITGGTITGITDLAVADGGTGASTAANARTNLGLAIGTDVQAWDANLDQIAALLPTADNFIVGNGTAWTLETPAQALASLGVTATAAELNILDGVTATTAELNYVDGVTSAIQTQLNAKAPLASPTFTGTVTAPAYDATVGGFTGIAADTAAAPSFTWSGDTDTGMYRVGTNSVGFSTLGTERLRIASAGQIGIGGANYGTSGQLLTSNGSAAAPSWQTFDVATAVAGLSAGAVGTYGWMRTDSAADYNYGTTVAGSTLDPSGFDDLGADYTQNSARSGTWRCMGYSNYTAGTRGGSPILGITLWLRIS